MDCSGSGCMIIAALAHRSGMDGIGSGCVLNTGMDAKGGMDGGSASFMGPGRRGVQGSNGTQHKGHYPQPSEQGTKDPESMSAVAFMHESLKQL